MSTNPTFGNPLPETSIAKGSQIFAQELKRAIVAQREQWAVAQLNLGGMSYREYTLKTSDNVWNFGNVPTNLLINVWQPAFVPNIKDVRYLRIYLRAFVRNLHLKVDVFDGPGDSTANLHHTLMVSGDSNKWELLESTITIDTEDLTEGSPIWLRPMVRRGGESFVGQLAFFTAFIRPLTSDNMPDPAIGTYT